MKDEWITSVRGETGKGISDFDVPGNICFLTKLICMYYLVGMTFNQMIKHFM